MRAIFKCTTAIALVGALAAIATTPSEAARYDTKAPAVRAGSVTGTAVRTHRAGTAVRARTVTGVAIRARPGVVRGRTLASAAVIGAAANRGFYYGPGGGYAYGPGEYAYGSDAYWPGYSGLFGLGAGYASGYYPPDYAYAPSYAYRPGLLGFGGPGLFGFGASYAYEPGYAYAPAGPIGVYTYGSAYNAPPEACWKDTDKDRGFGYFGSCETPRTTPQARRIQTRQ
jgi:hypothetical protein